MSLEAAVAAATGVSAQTLAPVAGGDINRAYRAELADGRSAFVKTRPDAPPGEYAAEAAALEWLAEPGGLPTPDVLGVHDPADADGATRVLKACASSGTVKRVVMTSSVAAVAMGHAPGDDKVRTEADWSNPDRCDPYPKSKTLAERAAWEIVQSTRRGEAEPQVRFFAREERDRRRAQRGLARAPQAPPDDAAREAELVEPLVAITVDA